MKRLFLYIFVALTLVVGRWMVVGQGMLDDTDEYVYFLLLKHWDKINSFEIYYWIEATFKIHLFPMELFIRWFQTKFILLFSSYKNLPSNHVQVMIIPAMFNIIVSLIHLFVVFKILRALNFSKILSLLGVFLLGTLLSMIIYNRHFLPYDNSLLFFTLALFLILRHLSSYTYLLLAGFSSALGFACYFSYFKMFIILSLLILLGTYSKGWRKVFFSQVLFFLPVSFYILGYDVVARVFYEKSFLDYMIGFSTTIYQGSYSEGLIFAFIHLFLIEKVWGLLLLVAGIAGSILIFKYSSNTTIKRLMFVFILVYIGFGLNAVLFEGMVFYARVFRLFYLPIIIGVLYLFKTLFNSDNHPAIIVIFILTFVNYGYVIKDLNSIAYPRGVVQNHGFIEDEEGLVKIEYVSELECALKFDKANNLLKPLSSKLTEGNYTMKNFCFFHHDGDLSKVYNPISIENGDLIFEKKHFMSHPSYTLDYCSKEGRKQLLKHSLYLRVYKKEF